MNNIDVYLNSNPNIKKVILLVGLDYRTDRFVDFLKNTDFDEFILTGFLSEDKVEKLFADVTSLSKAEDFRLPKVFKFSKFEELPRWEDDNWGLVFEWITSPADVLKYRDFNPPHLIGNFWENNISAFNVWETFRKVTKHIQIETIRYQKTSQILLWHKKEEDDVELSIIFPMYKVEKYLDQCIESVTRCKDDYMEFLFVNDGSPDGSRDIVLKWAKEDSRIKLIDKENGGCASARQKGLEVAKGRYVGFVDPDDFVEEGMFRKLMQAAMNGSYEISYCGYNEYYETTKQIIHAEDAIGYSYFDGIIDKNKIEELIAYCRVAIWRGIYSMDMLKRAKIHFYTELRRFDDLPFKVETFAVARAVIAVPEYLYYYRLARPGQDVSADDDRLYVHFDIFNHLNESIAGTNDQKLIDFLQICKIQTHRYAISKIKPEFLKYYMKKAKEDLNSTGTYKRTKKLLKDCLGKRVAKFYFALYFGFSGMVRKYSK